MDLIELVSPHVAVPVIGVVLCAFMVFAFGFRSPVQPPSFNFEEKKSKRRPKQTKLKGPVNGDVVTANLASEVVPKSTPKQTREVKPASSPKAKTNELKPEARKEVKQDVKGEKKVKAKKETVKDEVTTEQVKKSKVVSPKKEGVKEEASTEQVKKSKVVSPKKEGVKEEASTEQVKKSKVVKKNQTEEDGEWTTIQVSKKGKKQKPSTKKDGGRAESAVESENEPETTPASEAAAASPAPASEVDDGPSSPEVNRPRNKKKKDNTFSEKSKVEEKPEPTPEIPLISIPISADSIIPQTEDPDEGKKIKSKKDKKVSGEAAASAHENLPQDAASASGKIAKIAPRPAPVSAQDPVSSEQAKPSPQKKKKKSSGKESVQEETSEKVADIQNLQLEKPADSTQKLADNTTAENISKAVSVVPSHPPASPVQPQQAIPVAASQPPTGISFDEIGDSWQEATPKSKKKKSRRDN